MLTKGDAFFNANPDKVLGLVTFGFQNRMHVSGGKDTIQEYFKSLKTQFPESNKNIYIARVKLIEKAIAKDPSNSTLKARLKLLKKHASN